MPDTDDTVMKYRKKPVEIEAMQLAGTNAQMHDVYLWVERNTQGSFDPYADERPASGVSIDSATGYMLIATLEGVMQAKPGDWIIRGVQGEFYPCKPDIFEATYEPAAAPVRTPDVGGEVTAQWVHSVTYNALANEWMWIADELTDAVNERIRQAREQGRADGLREAAELHALVDGANNPETLWLRRMADEAAGR